LLLIFINDAKIGFSISDHLYVFQSWS